MILVTFQTNVGVIDDLKIASSKLFTDKNEFEETCLRFFNNRLNHQYSSFAELYGSHEDFEFHYMAGENNHYEYYEKISDFIDKFTIREITDAEAQIVQKFFGTEFGDFPIW